MADNHFVTQEDILVDVISALVNRLLVEHQEMLHQEYARHRDPTKKIMKALDTTVRKLEAHGVVVERSFLGLD